MLIRVGQRHNINYERFVYHLRFWYNMAFLNINKNNILLSGLTQNTYFLKFFFNLSLVSQLNFYAEVENILLKQRRSVVCSTAFHS